MTDREWARVTALILTNWPNSTPPEAALEKWRRDLADLPAAQVEAGVEALAADGREFCPNGFQIRAKVTELALDAPDWQEAAHLLGSIFDVPESVFDGNCSIPTRLNRIRELPELVQAFVARVGLDALNRGLVGGSEEARLRDKWTAFCARAERDRNYAQIPSSRLAVLERSSERPRRVGEIAKQITERTA